jgi:small subunit ribosomal protein S4
MGDPRRLKSKYSGPGHPWQMARLEEERGIVKEYGLRNKKEIWKALAKLKHFSNRAKILVNLTSEQAEKEKKQLLEKVYGLGILSRGSGIGDILGLNVKNMLDRRLQTLVFKKGFARTISQARQMITHGHILIGNKKMSIPSYYVLIEEEGSINFSVKSPFTDEMHPERTSEKAVPKHKKKAEEKGEKKEEKPAKAVKEKEEAKKEEEKKEDNNEEKEEAKKSKKEKKEASKPEEKKEEAKK